ncbi:hypothetical protein [Rubrobacter indicoceani]|uniref:hypothetical protein n=1 Tax=Rubrobacter indicoceani TaxID=2051957 RepID=UPI000E5AC998|nr:hypothetical protein [Rubrobacter indicoceani]
MNKLTCTARRTGDFDSRTEEYNLTFTVAAAERTVNVRYLASRAYEITGSLDNCVDAARAAIADAGLEARPTDEKLSKFAWYAMQSVKYDEGESKTSSLEL